MFFGVQRLILLIFSGMIVSICLWRFAIQEIDENNTVTLVPLIQNGTDTAISQPSTIQSEDDYVKLIDLMGFEFTIQHNDTKCNNQSDSVPLILVLIHSAPQNLEKRNLIRKTWGQPDARSQVLFLLGAVNSTQLQLNLEMENNLYQDIIQGNFYDAYRNMTYKHVMALKWFRYHCSNAKFLLKADDDIFINTPAVYDFLLNGQSMNVTDKPVLYCLPNIYLNVLRSYRWKWRVSPKEYPNRYYPVYCKGYSIIYSNEMVKLLYETVQQLPYFWIDDVHVTGTSAQKANVSITSLQDRFLNPKGKKAVLCGEKDIAATNFLFVTCIVTQQEILSLWKLIQPKR